MWNIPVFSTSLALMDGSRSEITHGVILNIPTGEMFTAISGNGAEKDGKSIRTRNMDIEKAVVSSYIGPEARGWVESLIFWPRRTRYFGCVSLEMCMVASGSFDLFVMFGRIPRLTDVAAGSLILRESGGDVFLLDKNDKISEFEPDFRREEVKAFFAIGDPTALRSVLEISNLNFTMGGK
jgi:myo-inositol-1(or 4)-monophosphatase